MPRLLLVAAPAGFGKTTLLAQWLGTADRDDALRVAWLSLDPGDSDLRRFLTHLVAAVQASRSRRRARRPRHCWTPTAGCRPKTCWSAW